MRKIKLGNVQVEIWGGANEIGGNQILLRDGNDALWLDFGRPFGRWGRYFTEFMQPRGVKGVRDLLALRLLPPIPELYRHAPDDTLFPTDIEHGLLEGSPIGRLHGVLLSHAHLDHAGSIAYLRRDLPIYTSAESAVILKAIQDVGNSDLDAEVVYLNRRVPDADRGILRAEGSSYLRRPYRLLGCHSVPGFGAHSPAKTKTLAGDDWQAEATTAMVGPFRVEALPVDHSIPGAVAFLIHTSEGLIAYTGDIRFHGERAGSSKGFLERLAQQRLLGLIVEGTRLGQSSTTRTEDEVQMHIRDAIATHAGKPIAIDFAARNVERLKRCADAARAAGRELVITAKDAYLLRGLSEVNPDYGDLLGQVRVLQEPKAQIKAWEERLWTQSQSNVRPIQVEMLAQALDKFVLAFGFFELNRLLDLRLASGSNEPEGVYIFSNSFWADDEQLLDLRVLLDWLRALNFRLLPKALVVAAEQNKYAHVDNPFHTSGHASQEDLKRLVEAAAPKYLIPVHTEQPSHWRALLGDAHKLGVEVRDQ